MSEKIIELLHDNPLKFKQNEEEYKQDGLNFKTYTKVITNAILHTQTPFTVGIFGEWGKGKTSFLEIIKQKVEHEKYQDKYLNVWFNAWQYEKEEHPIVPLIAVIIKALQDEKGEVKKGFEKFVNVLRSVAYGFSLETTNKDVLGNEIKMQLNSKDMIDRYEQLVASALLDKSLYFNAFEKLQDLEELKNKRIIVFIDDLDRCLPPNAIKLLESIKLVLSQKGFVFVLGVAKEVLEGHLNHKYEKEFGIKGGNHGKAYLEKMIQLPFTLPKFTQKVDTLVDSLFEKVEHKDDIKNIKEVVNAVATHSKVTPRLLVRLINQAKIHAEIDKELKNESVYSDMYASFVFVLLLDTFYEEEYKTLSVEVKSRLEELIYLEKLLENIKEKEYLNDFDKLCKSIKENKCLKNLLETKLAKEWLRNKDLRDRTIEFVDIATNVSEEEIKKQEEKRFENLSLEEVRKEVLALEDKVKTEEDFKKYIYDGKDSYKTFVKVQDEQGKEFEISKFLVTNKWYDEFRKGKREDYGEAFNHPFKPVVGVSYNDVKEFCEVLNDSKYKYSLPTKEQLEYLVSNYNTTKYPWGDDFDSKKCNNGVDLNLGKTSIVGAFSKFGGDSKTKITDMSGNIWKWTNSNFGKESKFMIGSSWRQHTKNSYSASDNGAYFLDKTKHHIGFYIIRTTVTL